MSAPVLTPEEARIIYTVLNRMWVPGFAYKPVQAVLHKLLVMGGGECCRDCTDLGTSPDRLGGMVCRKHDKRPPLQTFTNSAREGRP